MQFMVGLNGPKLIDQCSLEEHNFVMMQQMKNIGSIFINKAGKKRISHMELFDFEPNH